MAGLLLLTVLAQLAAVYAPSGLPFGAIAGRAPSNAEDARQSHNTRSSSAASAFVCSFIAAASAAAAATCCSSSEPDDERHLQFTRQCRSSASHFFQHASLDESDEHDAEDVLEGQGTAVQAAALGSAGACLPSASSMNVEQQGAHSLPSPFDDDLDSDAQVNYDDSQPGSESEEGDVEENAARGNAQLSGKSSCTRKGAGKLWSTAQFPEGTSGSGNYDLANLMAAQEWSCPCPDRKSCIGADRISVLELYDHRKDFQTTAQTHGGYRDAIRKALEQRYDAQSKSFIRAFKVGSLTDCCAASAGLAAGVSFATWSNARVDTKKKLHWRPGRKRARAKIESDQRATINAYI